MSRPKLSCIVIVLIFCFACSAFVGVNVWVRKTRPHISRGCDKIQLIDDHLLAIALGTPSPDMPPLNSLKRQVMEEYDLAPDNVNMWAGTVSWTDGDWSYRAEYAKSGYVVVDRQWERKWSVFRPNLADVLRCFGNPTMYDAYSYMDITPGFIMQLWYTDKGDRSFMVETLIFIGSDNPLSPPDFTEIPTRFDGRLPITDVYVGDMTDLASSPRTQLKPWPGNAEDIAIEQMRKIY